MLESQSNYLQRDNKMTIKQLHRLTKDSYKVIQSDYTDVKEPYIQKKTTKRFTNNSRADDRPKSDIQRFKTSTRRHEMSTTTEI